MNISRNHLMTYLHEFRLIITIISKVNKGTKHT